MVQSGSLQTDLENAEVLLSETPNTIKTIEKMFMQVFFTFVFSKMSVFTVTLIVVVKFSI